MLVECGFVRVQHRDGGEWTFSPSLGRIAALGSPTEVVELYADLHDPAKAADAARYVLASLCDQDDPTPLIGWHDADALTVQPGAMPAGEQIVIARHLLQHGMVGTAKPERSGDGQYTAEFRASEHIAAACVHLGMSTQDAEALSMTELHLRFDAKFPKKPQDRPEVSREQYLEFMAEVRGRRKRAEAKHGA